MLFTKEHLAADDYDWSNKTSYDFTKLPDRRAFNSKNGNQLIYMINSFGQSIGKLTLGDGQKLESLIRQYLPKDLKSELAVFNWLKGKYLYCWN
jgi:hypothetical protein